MFGLQLLHEILRRAPLLLIVIENRRAVLRAHVPALTIERRRIVKCEEDAEEIAVGDLVRVEFHLNDFRVPGRAGAHGLICGVGCVSPGVP